MQEKPGGGFARMWGLVGQDQAGPFHQPLSGLWKEQDGKTLELPVSTSTAPEHEITSLERWDFKTHSPFLPPREWESDAGLKSLPSVRSHYGSSDNSL